ncbi:phosphoenolpyruvate carboxykinase [Penaeus vannamei]|uniref:Phosphoenolpyruvate carboxykinase n=1 Tax=Penaeus vannamei TaxID=6689 RepID=A0A3R7MMZ8_PENVA|nr:uncharacterized protein LOC113823056 [Penaeus vannamei]ROT86034.1 phosphoenolpyruvate carboxykinase [Penaeus vannamei]
MAVLPSVANSASKNRRAKSVTVLTPVEDVKKPYMQEISTTFFNEPSDLHSKVRTFVKEFKQVWEPVATHPGDGTEREPQDLLCMTQQTGTGVEHAPGYTYCWLAHSDPGGVAY